MNATYFDDYQEISVFDIYWIWNVIDNYQQLFNMIIIDNFDRFLCLVQLSLQIKHNVFLQRGRKNC